MSPARTTREVAIWEFRRFFKPRDQLISFCIMIAFSAIGFGISWWQDRTAEKHTVAVIADFPVVLPATNFKVTQHGPEERQALEKRVADRDLDAVLVLDDVKQEVFVRREPAWMLSLRQAVQASVSAKRLSDARIDPMVLTTALQPVDLQVRTPPEEAGNRGARLFGAVLIGLMLLGLLTGLSYLFIGITGEKQLRVTEQLFAFVPAQSLVDGKLLGIAAVTLIGLIQIGVISALAGWIAGGQDVMRSMFQSVSPGVAITLLAFAVLGFAFYFALVGAVFATINDPTSSQRNSIMFLPFFPLSVALFGVSSPDSVAMQVLGYIPFTSMTVMPVRLVAGGAGFMEAAAALIVLFVAFLYARRAAARVFEIGMLMFGKEPRWTEVWKWARTK